MATRPMTPQRLFNKVATHLMTQRLQSMQDEVCQYRGPNGLKCANGALIPNSCYIERVEGIAVDSLLCSDRRDKTTAFLKRLLKTREVRSLASHLQNLHDYTSECYWLKELKTIADVFDLSPRVLEKFEKITVAETKARRKVLAAK